MKLRIEFDVEVTIRGAANIVPHLGRFRRMLAGGAADAVVTAATMHFSDSKADVIDERVLLLEE